MSEEKPIVPPQPLRALEDIQKEYETLCSNAGQKQYYIHVLTNEIRAINNRILQVNQEADAAKALAAKGEQVEAKQ